MKICITGGPRTGKSTYAEELSQALGLTVWSTDVYASMPWADQAIHVAKLIQGTPAGIIEGVTVARGLRRLLQGDPATKWCDQLYVLRSFKATPTPAQEAMAKGVNTTLEPMYRTLRQSGILLTFL